jgi:hypothetical protein
MPDNGRVRRPNPLLFEKSRLTALPELRGRDLVCWCAPLPCHGDVLLELASKR